MSNISSFYLGQHVPEWGGLGATPEVDDLFVPSPEDYEEHVMIRTQPNTEFNRKLALNNTPFPDVVDIATQIVDYTLQHGGGTFTALGKEFGFTVGYIVGGFLDTVVVKDVANHRERAIDAVARFRQRMGTRDVKLDSGESHSVPYYHVGTWVEDGDLYIDASKWFSGFLAASAAARKNGELAIYDVEEGESLYRDDEGRYLIRK